MTSKETFWEAIDKIFDDPSTAVRCVVAWILTLYVFWSGVAWVFNTNDQRPSNDDVIDTGSGSADVQVSPAERLNSRTVQVHAHSRCKRLCGGSTRGSMVRGKVLTCLCGTRGAEWFGYADLYGEIEAPPAPPAPAVKTRKSDCPCEEVADGRLFQVFGYNGTSDRLCYCDKLGRARRVDKPEFACWPEG